MMLLLLMGALYVGNNACAPCHKEIFNSYRYTPMAQSSGIVNGGLPPGSFIHHASGIRYRIDTEGTVTVQTPATSMERKLEYFIGSGAAGRSFLYTREGALFQAPVTWYSQQGRWDVSPGYEQDPVSRWNRPITADCLNCHSSQVRAAVGFVNRYANPPFAQTGIGCERCHGPGSQHVVGRGTMVNPARLEPPRRDSVCAQCHMSGEARVIRAGKRLEDYRPGDLLSDYVRYFVYQGAPKLKATSYVEKLAASRCKIASGDRLWCGTCHDPHWQPAVPDRVSWYRAKCLSCHAQAECRRGDDCASCHMPRAQVSGGGHGVLTDHSIPRRPSDPALQPANTWVLQPFSPSDTGAREQGLAYAELAARTGDVRQMREALRLLSNAGHDTEVELRLADLFQRAGEPRRAADLYRSVLEKAPGSVVALVNLANAYAGANDLKDAEKLWREALRRQPCQTEAARNLRTVYQARKQVEQMRELSQQEQGCTVQ